MYDLSHWEAIERIVVALVAGALLGLEREWTGKAAGIRTYALAAEGAALFMIAALLLGDEMRAAGLTYDPSRIAATVVQGIGFIAAGVIIRHKAQVRGLTTAAGLWVSAAVGLLIGAGFYFVAFAAVAATILALIVLKSLEGEIEMSEKTGAAITLRRVKRIRLRRKAEQRRGEIR